MPSIYLSYAETSVLDSDQIECAQRFVNALRSRRLNLVYIAGFSTYETIERSIRAADALVAVVDECWSSSTWRLSEVTFAAGETPVGVGLSRMKPIPVFLFPAAGKLPPALSRLPGETLPSEPETAASVLEERFSGA